MIYSQAIDYFTQLQKKQQLHHAYLFTGPSGIGKVETIRAVCSVLLQKEISATFQHPNIICIQQELNPKTKKTKSTIDVGQIRQLRERLSHSLLGEGYQIAIILNAEKMSVSASNALLKTLEEPRGNTILFLSSSQDDALLPTIHSRVQHIEVSPCSHENIRTALKKEAIHDTLKEEIILASQGYLGYAVQWSQDPTTFETYKETKAQFIALLGKSFIEKMRMVEPLLGDKSDPAQTKAALFARLQIWEHIIRIYLLELLGQSIPPQYPTLSLTRNPQIYLHAIDTIEQTRQYLLENSHPKLLFERLLLVLGDLETSS